MKIKRVFSLALALLMIVAVFIPMSVCAVTASDSKYVYDMSGELQTDQYNIVNTRCEWLKEKGIPTIIYIDRESGKSPSAGEEKAAEYLEDGFGAVFYINCSDNSSAFEVYGVTREKIDETTAQTINSYAMDKYNRFGIYSACATVVSNITFLIADYHLENEDFYNYTINDYAGELSAEADNSLEAQLEVIRTANNFDVAVVIDAQLWGDTPEQAADDTYDYYMYGYGETRDGILLYIADSSRDYWITTCGAGQKYFTSNGLDRVQDAILPYLKDDDYEGAISEFGDVVNEIIISGASGQIYDEKQVNWSGIIVALIAALIVAFLIAKAMTSNKVKEMKTARLQLAANNYVKEGSFNLTTSKDIFLYSAITSKPRPKSNSNDGGSHTSSSGSSHGGAGGKF